MKEEHWSKTCEHEQAHWTRFLCMSSETGQRTSRQINIRKQCTVCGYFIEQSKRCFHPDWENYPEFDYELRKRISDECWQGVSSLPPPELMEEEFDYDKYLQSDEWKKLRKLVFKRCDNVCEGCGVSRAQQVHHLTYKRIGDELLFDLVGVCNSCHEYIHE